MKRIVLIGKNGQLGWELQRTLAVLGEVHALDRHTLDLAAPDTIRAALREIKPDIIVNAAAYTAVDKAESEPELAMAINGTAPGILAEEAKRLGAALIHYSTDYVFDGSKTSAYTENDIPAPLNTYGTSKRAGELAIEGAHIPHLILRTSWIYGQRSNNFLLTILRLAKERDLLKIVDDQHGAPTWSVMIAQATAHILHMCCASPAAASASLHEMGGIYHLSARGETSWYNFARAILANSMFNTIKVPQVFPIASADYPLPAPRPRNSVLSNDKLRTRFGLQLPDWETSLNLCLQQATP